MAKEGLDSSYPEMQRWYVVYSKPRKEEFAQFHLRSKGLEVFLPRLLLPQSADRGKRVVPLFPNYLFVRIHIFSEEYSYVAWSPGVKRFIGFNGTPTPLDDGIVDFLMQQATDEGIITARSNLKVGQEVQIASGPFTGLLGIIKEPPNAKGRVQLLLELLSRQVQVEIPAQCIKASWVPY